ncbi:hypothetical protein SSPO_037200 [Streptomyces antimycoticus]|uniref:HTH tetR-type domain-containing protein n=1 Tax=Streptomyces antimycoticus TaxID=68175 RepID=A0A499UJM2_9ACTN|nr:helix-turn-helix domain-containing protein [Streptomyces antimycoticus]BBJ41002.1 hypothetical protein SSPO_037200 [Streptomyces antimycoticus]
MSTARPSAHERILSTATALFNAHGVRGVGVDRIIAESGVAKATLYSHFRTKDDLVLAYLHRSDQHWRGRCGRPPRRPAPIPGTVSSESSTR